MLSLQRLLSSVLNLLFHDPEQPTRLWPWWQLGLVVAVVAAVGWLVATA